MKTVFTFCIAFVVVILCSMIFSEMMMSNTKVEMTGNASGATMTTTGPFGQKTTCETMIVGQTVKTFCN